METISVRHQRAARYLAALACLISAVPAHANLITNGSFSNVIGPVPSEIRNDNLPGWAISGSSFLSCVVNNTATTDACGSTGQSAGSALWADPGPSPDGGNYVLIDGDPAVAQTLSQTLNGLVKDQFYNVSFFQSAAQFKFFTGATTERWLVSFGGAPAQMSALMSNASHGTLPWQAQTLTFQATGTSAVLGFYAVGTALNGGSPAGLPPVVLLDGVSVTAVPEPQILALLGIGMLAAFAVRHKRRHD